MKGQYCIKLVLLLLLTGAGKAVAQSDKVEKALSFYSAKNLDSAKIVIDQAVKDPATMKDHQAWMVRGFVYKELYKTNEAKNPSSLLRDTAVASLKNSLLLDAENKNPQRDKVIQSLKYVAATYHNDINKTLDTLNYNISLLNAEKHAAIMKSIDPAFDEKKYMFEVYSTAGSMFEKNFERGASKTSLDLAKTYLMKAYDMNGNSEFVNKNLGVLYYNQAVDVIKKMDYDVPLDQLPVYQDQSVKLGQQALPYMLKAHELNPKDKSVVEGLAGIYYLLNETEKHNEYKKKLEELNRQ